MFAEGIGEGAGAEEGFAEAASVSGYGLVVVLWCEVAVLGVEPSGGGVFGAAFWAALDHGGWIIRQSVEMFPGWRKYLMRARRMSGQLTDNAW